MTRDEKLIYQAEVSRRYRERNKDNPEYRAKRCIFQKKYAHSEKGKKTARKSSHTERSKNYQENYHKAPYGRYKAHRGRAKKRNIEWLFTFETWWKIWEPCWGRRGQASNDLQMCRTGDKGPYSPENVRIDTCANNVKEAWEIRRNKP